MATKNIKEHVINDETADVYVEILLEDNTSDYIEKKTVEFWKGRVDSYE